MKRWILRLLALSTVTGLGIGGVMWAQHRWANQETPGPDWSQSPVNSEAVAGLSVAHGNKERYARQSETSSATEAAATRRSDAPAERGPVDPFQGFSSANSSGDYRSMPSDRGTGAERASNPTVDENVSQASGVDRVASSEPRRLDADTAAAPIAPEPSATVRGVQEESAAPADRGMAISQATSAPPSSGETAAPTNELRYMDDNARKASGIAATTGVVEAVNDARQVAPMASSSRNRYPNGSPAGGGYRQLPASGDSRSLDNPPNIDNADAALARSMPGGPATENTMPTAGMPDRTIASGNYDRMMPGNASVGNGATTNTMPGNSALPVGAAAPGGMLGVTDGSGGVPNVEGSGKPGDKKLEGAQTPSVTIEKIAPPEIQVGKEASFEVIVRNTGPVPANDVQVTDVVPQGTRLLNTTPRTSVGQRGEIVWKVGDLKPGEDSKLQVVVMPLQEGEIGSTAVVQFRSAASMRTVATKPDLVLELNAAQQVMIGEDVKLQIKLSNPGTGAANKVILSARISPNFQHPAGNELEFEIGRFVPGESRELDLTLHAQQAGPGSVTLIAQGDANLHIEKAANIEVVAPRVEVKLAGPGMRYLDRQAKYTVTVGNPGTAAAKNITLTTHLPKGMQFVEASDSGQYDAASNSVMWGLDELPAGQSGNVNFTTTAKEIGDQKIRSEVKAASGLSDAADQVTVVEGVAAVNFTVAHLEDPVEVGGQATYEIHIINQGSKAANRLQVVARMPPEIKPVSGEGPSRQAIEGQQVVFEPLARLAPKADVTYRVVGQCLAPGDLRVQVFLQTDDMAKPVVKEEGTRVYKD